MDAQTSIRNLLPTMASMPFIDINLDLLFQNRISPLVTPPFSILVQQRIIWQETLRLGAYTYGGYLEDREFTWQKTYLEKDKKFIHLGVDINVPANTPVFSPIDGRVIDILVDTDEDIGWGARVIVEPSRAGHPLLLFAHLAPDIVSLGRIQQGDSIGLVGTYPQNGNVFEHLHVQAIHPHVLTDPTWKESLDGYLSRSRHILTGYYPHPLEAIDAMLGQR